MNFLRSLVSRGPVVPVIRLEGVIQSGGRSAVSANRNINLANTARMIDRAFSFSRSPAVALVINSPGGSAVQSHLIARRILKLSEEKKKPVYAFVEDAAASGGYILALSASEIYADPFSIVGSIGVIHASFGFTDLMQKIGVERRLQTAGKHKSMLDPFSEATEDDKERLRQMLGSFHLQFKSFVKERRGDKLKQADGVLFEGDFWVAEKAAEYGLIDGLGDVRTVMRNKFGAEVNMPLISPMRGMFPFAPSELSSTSMSTFQDVVNESELWRKYGL